MGVGALGLMAWCNLGCGGVSSHWLGCGTAVGFSGHRQTKPGPERPGTAGLGCSGVYIQMPQLVNCGHMRGWWWKHVDGAGYQPDSEHVFMVLACITSIAN